ncbi:MAG: hypothetical protein GVX78_03275 [Bacteroidetes bacterium]|jgi:tetratricopeptide (TPR) repeat protein|nr:hypothetical protein [Bacteroidota bacterium]
MKNFIYIIALIFLPWAVCAQPIDKQVEEAYLYYKEGKLTEAAEIINDISESKKGRADKVVWHIRAFIYKDIFMDSDSLSKTIDAREEAISSVQKSRERDKNKSLEEMNKKVLKYLAESYYNDASDIITDRNKEQLPLAEKNYNRYKDVINYVFPDTSLTHKDIEFYLAMSTAYRKIYEADREENEQYFEKAVSYLDKVLNYAANYSKSVSYYNQGAHGLERLPDAKLTDIYDVQSESMRSIEMALPFMLKAYELNPNKVETVKGLRWMYHNLQRLEKSEEMKQKELELKSDR